MSTATAPRTDPRRRADGKCLGSATPGWHDASGRTADAPNGSSFCVHCGRGFDLNSRGNFPAHSPEA